MKRMSEKTHDFLATSICFNYNDSAIRCDDGDDDDDYCYFNLHCFAPQESSSEMCVHVRSRNNRCHTPNNATSVARSLNNGHFPLVYTPHIHLTSIVLSIEWKNTKQKTKEKEREFAQPRTFDRAIGHWTHGHTQTNAIDDVWLRLTHIKQVPLTIFHFCTKPAKKRRLKCMDTDTSSEIVTFCFTQKMKQINGEKKIYSILTILLQYMADKYQQ